MNVPGFREPSFLWALLFLGLVPLIHLLKHPRTVRLDFSTLRFFDDSTVSDNRARHLRKILLLLTRLFLSALVIVLFAGPFDKSDPLSFLHDPEFDLYLWVDPTPSMSYRENGISRGELAYRLLDSIALLRHGSGRTFIYSQETREFLPFTGEIGSPYRHRYSPGLPDFYRSCVRAARESKRPVILVASDFQSSITGRLDSLWRSEPLRKVPVVGVPFMPRSPWNGTVAEVHMLPGEQTAIESRLLVSGNRQLRGELFAMFDQIRSPPQRHMFSGAADTSLIVSVGRNVQSGWGKVLFSGSDPLSFDDTCWFTAGTGGACSVLVIGGEPESYPLAAALRVSGGEKRHVESRSPESISFQTCGSADVIVLNGYRDALPQIELLRRARGKKKQSFILAPEVDGGAARYAAEKLLDVPRGSLVPHSGKPLGISLPDTVSSLWRGFPSLRCSGINIYGYYTGLAGIPLLSLSNGEPLAVRRTDGFGRTWFVLATPLGITEANNFCETGFYVPFIDRLASTAFATLENRSQTWVAGVPVRNPLYGKGDARMIDLHGTLIADLGMEPRIVVETPGVYKIVPGNGTPYFTTVVPDSMESRLVYEFPEKREDGGRWLLIEPPELIDYMKTGKGRAGRWIPWLTLGMLLLGEFVLRGRRR